MAPQRTQESVGSGEVQRGSGEVQRNIARRVVALHKEYYGKGPKRAKCYYLDDVVLVVLRGGYTKVEETLLAEGRGEAVINQRMEFQEIMVDRFREVVTEETGRQVVALMSGSHQDPDLTSEVFVLETTDLLADDHGPEA